MGVQYYDRNIIQKPGKGSTHLCAPFLDDREYLITVKSESGLCQRSLQMEADNLLNVVNLLYLKEHSTEKVSLETILTLKKSLDDQKYWFFVNAAVRLLSRINLLDDRYMQLCGMSN